MMLTEYPRRTRVSHVRERPRGGARASGLWRAADEPHRADGLLLDTHAWLWTLNGDAGGMASQAIVLIESAAARSQLCVSDISFWEVALKAAKGKLSLGVESTIWLARAAATPGITGLPITREVLVQSTLLPGALHGDPADRILLAQAQISGLSLLTCDQLVIEYAARERSAPVCDARH
ncbi:MAG TPA: type II toxin-antitoxin system VapC family toxin [Gemmatimonadaceae bacterium]